MTAVELLAWITALLLLQVAVGTGVAVWRRRHLAVLPLPSSPVAPARDAAWPGWREFSVVRREYEDAAHTQCSFYLQPVDGKSLPAFKPGQYLTFSLDVTDETGGTRSITRCYSLSDQPDPSCYRVTIKRVPAPADQPGVPAGLSSNHFHDRVGEGAVLRVKAPSGHFVFEGDASVPAVLIGGGIGITPVMSMLRWCVTEQPVRPVRLYYGVRNGEELAFKSALGELVATHPALDLHVVFSRPGAADIEGRDFHHRGHVDVDLLKRTLPHGRHQFFVCGPPAMMQTLVPMLAAWGVPRGDLHFEAFGPASIRLPGEEAGQPPLGEFEVHFTRSGRTVTWDNAESSLLDFAERHGVVVESGCRSGGCGTCETRLLEGEVRYAQSPDHDVAQGHCLLCIGRPATPLVLDA